MKNKRSFILINLCVVLALTLAACGGAAPAAPAASSPTGTNGIEIPEPESLDHG